MAPSRTHVFLDLDGTLLSSSVFFRIACLTRLYWRLLPLFGPLNAYRYGKKMFRALLSNSPLSGLTNFERLLHEGERASGKSRAEILARLEYFYSFDFPRMKKWTWRTPGAHEALAWFESKKLKLAIVTNPIWPLRCVLLRLEWAGLDPARFVLITNSEIMHACKPNPQFYHQCLEKLNLEPAQALMVGNDKVKDGSAMAAGIPVILLAREGWMPVAELELRFNQVNRSGSSIHDNFLSVSDETGRTRNI
ncbi:MAG: HAD family hydrolase [Bdellovibrionia bacterium]